jgi:anti-sigma factor RsiW
MNTDPRLCADIRALLADHLDGLLDEAQAARVHEHLAYCEDCAAEAERLRRVHAALTTPWDVPAPSTDLPLRALASARARNPRVGRVVAVTLRYVATFAAGVLAAFLVLQPERARPLPTPVGVAQAVPAPAPAAEPATEPGFGPGAPTYSPKRIR